MTNSPKIFVISCNDLPQGVTPYDVQRMIKQLLPTAHVLEGEQALEQRRVVFLSSLKEGAADEVREKVISDYQLSLERKKPICDLQDEQNGLSSTSTRFGISLRFDREPSELIIEELRKAYGVNLQDHYKPQ